ncbi:MAG: carbohydrate kinase family protein, partial [Bacteroidales bacterium]|nr:carbohydrate kinase family protein [Bacteroidales bacterium]
MANTEKRNGICAAGTLVVDTIKMIPVFPTIGNLVTITEVQKALGGLTHNCLMDIAKLKSGLPLYAGGCVGNDSNGAMAIELFKEAGINIDALEVVDDDTSYTDVMSETGGKKTRTFFHYRGACDHFNAEKVLAIENNAKIFHLGYLLLLTEMDKDDPEYGIVAARVLDGLRKKGYKTSVDLVSEESDRFRHIV